MTETNKKFEVFLDKTLDVFFSKDKTKLFLILIFLLALVLRIFAATNLGVAADDMVFAVHAINFLDSNKLEVYDQSTSLWYSLTDLFYKIFGPTQLASRFASVLFGSLLVILVYLISIKLFKDKKIGLIAAFITAISPYFIKYTVAEMDTTAAFFLFLSIYLFMDYAQKKSNYLFIFSALSMGLAILTKSYSAFFIPGILYYCNIKMLNNDFSKKERNKRLLLFFGIVILFALPTLISNFLLFKDKKIMDFEFSHVFGKYVPGFNMGYAEQLYGWNSAWTGKIDFKGFIFGHSMFLANPMPSAIYCLKFPLFGDILITIIGIIGLIILFKKKDKYRIFFLAIFTIPYVFLASRVILPKHFLFVLILLIFPAAYLLNKLHNKYLVKKGVRLRYLLIIILIYALIFLGTNYGGMENFYSKSEIGQFIDMKHDFPKNSLIVGDSRIYRGQGFWLGYGRYYIESAYLAEVIQVSNSSKNPKVLTEVYFIECIPDDCGWGTIRNQPDFNKSMENIVSFFMKEGKLKKEIYSSTLSNYYYPIINQKAHRFSVYKTSMLLDPMVLDATKQTNNWFLYPVGYDRTYSKIFDDYSIQNPIDSLLNKLGLFIIRAGLVLALLSAILLLYLFVEENE
jgi:4-amino-4-deoxy-L-arabinose transferase-like glycosyltransferase